MTRSDDSFASVVISSSVMPSTKYSWVESSERFPRGNTATDRMAGDSRTPRDSSRERAFSVRRIARVAMRTADPNRTRELFRADTGAGGDGPVGFRDAAVRALVLTGPMN